MQVSDGNQVWARVAEHLRTQLTEAVWFSTFSDVRPIKVDDRQLTVSVPSNQARDRIMTRWLPLVNEALDEVIGPGCQLVVLVDPNQEPTEQDQAIGWSDVGTTDRRLTTSTVTRPSRCAAASALRRCSTRPDSTRATRSRPSSRATPTSSPWPPRCASPRRPARSYNPLFIYGAAGLGKTHLLHAIGHYVHHNYQHHDVRYVSTETFLNEFVDAIRNKTNTAFKRRYRDVDVLLIDDIQFLEKREGLQEEFFHTFNSLHGANKQIVISCDRMPDAIPTLEERLSGRFKWGLITDIQPPDLETRLAILRNKAEREQVQVPPETLEFIATQHHDQHPRARRRADPGHRVRQPQPVSRSRPSSPSTCSPTCWATPTSSRAPTRSCSPRSPTILGFEVAALEGQEPPAPARHGPPDRDVRLPRPHRAELPEHRPAVRRPRPHHRDPRRRQDPEADERAQADLRPGHRPAPAAEVVDEPGAAVADAVDSAADSLGTRARSRRGQLPRRPPNDIGVISAPGDDRGRTRRARARARTLRRRGLSPIHSPYYHYYFYTYPDHGKGPTVKFRCERDVLADALATAGRAATSRTGTLPGAVRPAPGGAGRRAVGHRHRPRAVDPPHGRPSAG